MPFCTLQFQFLLAWLSSLLIPGSSSGFSYGSQLTLDSLSLHKEIPRSVLGIHAGIQERAEGVVLLPWGKDGTPPTPQGHGAAG